MTTGVDFRALIARADGLVVCEEIRAGDSPLPFLIAFPGESCYNEYINPKEAAVMSERPVDACSFLCVHEDVVEKVQQNLPDLDELLRLAELFKNFGDGTRVRILYVLLEAEVCVCDLATLLGMSQSAVSHQLRVLKDARLIKARRDGKTVFYSLADDHVATLLRQGMEHICEE